MTNDIVPESDREILIKIATRMDSGFTYITHKLDDLCERLKAVEEVTNEVKNFPTFRDTTCPQKMNQIEQSLQNVESRLGKLENDHLVECGEEQAATTFWSIPREILLMTMGAIVAAIVGGLGWIAFKVLCNTFSIGC